MEITILDFRYLISNYKTITTKTDTYASRVKDTENTPSTCNHLIFDKTHSGEKTASLPDGTGKTRQYMQKIEAPFLPLILKLYKIDQRPKYNT